MSGTNLLEITRMVLVDKVMKFLFQFKTMLCQRVEWQQIEGKLMGCRSKLLLDKDEKLQRKSLKGDRKGENEKLLEKR